MSQPSKFLRPEFEPTEANWVNHKVLDINDVQKRFLYSVIKVSFRYLKLFGTTKFTAAAGNIECKKQELTNRIRL